ncbi:hypothetical protein AVEN_50092-1, partial [Araneus ventricosus]
MTSTQIGKAVATLASVFPIQAPKKEVIMSKKLQKQMKQIWSHFSGLNIDVDRIESNSENSESQTNVEAILEQLQHQMNGVKT